jgi:hypothetical protein
MNIQRNNMEFGMTKWHFIQTTRLTEVGKQMSLDNIKCKEKSKK